MAETLARVSFTFDLKYSELTKLGSIWTGPEFFGLFWLIKFKKSGFRLFLEIRALQKIWFETFNPYPVNQTQRRYYLCITY
jgi:hypothetical protein